MRFPIALTTFLVAICALFQTFATAEERLVVIGAELVEIAHALGAGHRIVANDRHSTYPAAAKQTATLGYFRAMTPEGIMSMQPSLIIRTPSSGPAETFDILTSAGLPLLTAPDVDTVDDVTNLIRFMASTLKLKEQGEALVGKFEHDLAAALALPAPKARAVFIMAISSGAPVVAGRGTVPDELFKTAGAQNAAEFQGFKPVSQEAMVGLAPDVIIIMKDRLDAVGGKARLVDLPGIKDTPAGQKQNIISDNSILLLRLGPRTPMIIEKLRTTLRKLSGS